MRCIFMPLYVRQRGGELSTPPPLRPRGRCFMRVKCLQKCLMGDGAHANSVNMIKFQLQRVTVVRCLKVKTSLRHC